MKIGETFFEIFIKNPQGGHAPLSPNRAKVVFKILDGRIAPILCHGAELWGSEPRHQIEQVHRGFCKFILGLGQSAHSSAALGEYGKLPLFIQYEKRHVKYWLKLLNPISTDQICHFQCQIELAVEQHRQTV